MVTAGETMMRSFAAAAALASALAAPAQAEPQAQDDRRVADAMWRGPAAAAAGDAEAQHGMGLAHKFGRGATRDPALARAWFRRAALQGHLKAQAEYGLSLFQSGERAEALPWLEKAAARGEPRAQYLLAVMLFNGDAVARDPARAHALMTRAAAAGLRPATEALARMDRHVAPQDRRRGMAMMRTPAAPAARPQRTAASAPAAPPAPTTGGYRVQLGAFRDPANARALWNQVGARVGGQPLYVPMGGLTRLQVGPFRTRAEASAACAKAAVSCVVVGP